MEDYAQEVNKLAYHEGEYIFEHPLFYEATELWRSLATIERIASKHGESDLLRGVKLSQGLIAGVVASAIMELLDQAVVKANESAPSLGEALLEEFKETELYKYATQSIPNFDSFFTNLDMTQSNSVEMLKLITGVLRVSRFIDEMSKSLDEGSPQLNMMLEMLRLGVSILNDPQKYVADATNFGE